MIRRAYPNLHAFPGDDSLTVRGGFPVVVDGTTVDRFQIAVTVPGDYPRALPIMRETGGRIPRVPDRHMEPDGRACLFVEEEARTYFPPGSPLLRFFQGPINTFLVAQLHFENFGTWPFGQRSHGAAGIAEFYAERLQMSQLQAIVTAVGYLRHREIKGHWPCPCGSGKRLRACHMRQILALHDIIPTEVAGRSYARLA
ncbi:MAG: SEC-C domain-containing protein [Thermoanaerobaculales bacterium]